MRWELKRLDILGATFPYSPHNNIRYVATADAVLASAASDVLVLGCGRGLVEYLLPDGLPCVSVDSDPAEIEKAVTINRWKYNRAFTCGDIFKLNDVLGQRTFDCVVVSEVIEHVTNDRGALEVVRDRVRPGGRFILTAPNIDRFPNRARKWAGRPPLFMSTDHLREYTAGSLQTLLTDVGFTVEKWLGVGFEFPQRPGGLERRFAPYSLVRSALSRILPTSATFVLVMCRK